MQRARSHAPVHIQPAHPRWPATPPATTTAVTPSAFELPVPNFDAVPLSPGFTRDLAPASPGPLFPAIWDSTPFTFTVPTPLYPPLSGTDIECSNSLMLTEHDQKYFQYFPASSIVFYYIKSWTWSSFNYLYQGPAVSNKVIMRMIIALSASDMHRNGLVVRSPGRPTADDHARYHYGLAVKEFRQLLETREGPVSQTELEMVFATMFLMISYEWQFGQSIQDLQLHLRGVRSLLESHPNLFQIKDVDEMFLSMDSAHAEDSMPKVSFIPEQLLLWILYVLDSSSKTPANRSRYIDSSCRPMGMTESLYEYAVNSGNPAIHPDRLYRCARLWGRCFWGTQYPDQEVTDDIENYRALELLHVGMMLRHKTWQALMNDPVKSEHQAKAILNEIMAIREV